MSADAPPLAPLRSLVEDLHARREQIKLGGGEEKIARQHAAEKLTARERLALLIDDGTWVELGIHGRPHFSQAAMAGKDAPADGVVTGYGKVDGRLVAVAAYDFTVMAGSMGMTGELKVSRLRELALTKRIPMVWLLDSAGARIQEAVGSLFAGSGHLFREEVVASGVVPQVAALMGPCAAGTAYIPGLADFVPMVRGRGSMALAGPHLVRAAVGENVTQEELGGSRVHCRKSGGGGGEGGPATTRSASRGSRNTCRTSRRTARRRRRWSSAATRSTAATRSCSTCSRSPTASPMTCTT
jgi:acetyl-CoA carboxylase carboxyltransferase component